MGGVSGDQHQLLRLIRPRSLPAGARASAPPASFFAPDRAPAAAALLALGVSGCLTGGGAVVLPDAASIAEAGRARSEAAGRDDPRHRRHADPEFAARLDRFGARMASGHPAFAGSAGEDGSGASGLRLRFEVTDSAETLAGVYADGVVVMSRGFLAALGGWEDLGRVVGDAVGLLTGGGFRPEEGGPLARQPLPLALPERSPRIPEARGAPGLAGTPRAAGAPEEDAQEWPELLDGLPFGPGTEVGVADGPRLHFPREDVRMEAPEGYAWEGRGDDRFAATGPDGAGLRARAVPAHDGAMSPDGFDARALALRLHVEAGLRDAVSGTPEVFHVRGFQGVRTRLHRTNRTNGPQPADGAPSAPNGSSPVSPVLSPPGEPDGFLAFLVAGAARVEIALDCAERPFPDCEADLDHVLESAARIRGAPTPGPLRLRAHRVASSGPARAVLARLYSEGASDAPPGTLERLNRHRLDDDLAVGDVILVARRDPPGSGERPQGPTSAR